MSPENRQPSCPLERHRLSRFIKGWFVGNFTTTLIASDAVEVAVKHYKAGDHESSHHHKVATELTAIVSGRVRMSGEEIGAREIIKIHPGQSTDFTALTDAITVTVKMPCVAWDKYVDAVGT
jgi:mannose-6-phosphate isomerase-like protein (cupin superfamily)